MQITQGIHRAVQVRGDATATVFGARRRTWRQHRDRVAAFAGGLRTLGLSAGDRVAIIAHNSDLYIEAFNAIAWAGGVSVPSNVRWTESEHEHAIRDSGAHILMVDAHFATIGARLAESCDCTLVLLDAEDTGAGGGAPSSDMLIRTTQPIVDACGHGDELCFILYTGGTTGRSKGVMLSHRGLISGFLAVNATVSAPPDQIFLHSAPMFHLAGATTVLAVTLTAGTHVVLPNFSPQTVIEAITRESVTSALLVPTMFAMLRDHLEKHPADLSSVRRIRYGASAISETLLNQAMKLFPNAEFQQGYGQTELSASVTVLEPRFHIVDGGKSYLRSAGRPVVGVDVRVVNDGMQECPVGTIGEVVARTPGMMLGYWNLPALTDEVIVDGWVRTGDMGYFDEEGFLYIVDRLKDMIVTGGENVFSAEVENALHEHPAVAECAVIGVPDAKWGERVHAILRFREGAAATFEQLEAHCRAVIAAYKCPRSFEVRQESLPLSAQGKVLKSDLRRPYWDQQQRKVG